MLAATVISRYSGHSFEDFVSHRILSILNITSSTYWPSVAISSGHQAHTFAPSSRRIPHWFTDANTLLVAGPMGVISNTEDLVRWSGFLLGHGPVDASNAIPTATLEGLKGQTLMSAAGAAAFMPLPSSGRVTYGYGWWQFNYNGHELHFLRNFP
jgi:CubicO group peptidase (beta-lactamase class C family)